MVQCPICGKNCKNAFYLGRHVSQKTDDQHKFNGSSNSKPSLSDSMNDSSGTTPKENVTPEGDNVPSSGSSSSVEWETEEKDDNWRELNPNNSRESDLLAQGYEEINMELEEVR